jgi:isopenicillin-N N-acyltransferase-like protein
MTETLREVSVSGSRYELGRQHGEACADLIRRVLAGRAAIIQRATGMPAAQAVEAGLRYLPSVAGRFPQFIEEVKGIADGAGVAFAEAFFVQVATELGFTAGAGAEGCTTLARRSADGHWVVAQNWDTPPDVHGLQIVLRVRPDDAPEAVMFTYAGVIGYMGINRLGVCHVASQLLSPDWRVGVTHYWVKRRFLELDSVGACLDVVREVPISSSGSYVLGDPSRAVVVEWLPSGVSIREGDHLAHTNHILDPSLRHLERYLDALPDSPIRLERLQQLMNGALGSNTGDALATAKSMLADHAGHPAGICRHGGAQNLHTRASVIFEPSKAMMHLAYGNPCMMPYQTYVV